MHTELSEKFQNTSQGTRAQQLISKCVHCGFCNATCPTYQLLGDELDGPRGRSYQIKQLFEGTTPDPQIALHLDRCLTCRSCETTCPSGVEYHHLLDLGREVVESNIQRGKVELLQKWLLRHVLAKRNLVTPLMRLAQVVRPVLPNAIKAQIPASQSIGVIPKTIHSRRMLLLEGCVQPGMKPLTNAVIARVLDRLGVTVVKEKAEQCCGALSYHLNAQQQAKQQMRQNIDAWWPHVESGVEAIISSASGCGVMVKDYGHLFVDETDYAEKAVKISELCKDISQILDQQDLSVIKITSPTKVAFHPPCTLQHGQKITGVVESILARCGYQLIPFADSHLCCGSAGTYSIFQKQIATQLLDNKLAAIEQVQPDIIANANIGCQLHLESKADIPVVHWVELLDYVNNSEVENKVYQ